MKPDRYPAPDLTPFFSPTGIAVLGASRHPGKLGHVLARNLVDSGYGGPVHFVNPSGGTLLHHPVYPSIAAVPDPVDLAVILVAAPRVPEALQGCGERGIKAAVIASGGFRETGPDGLALEKQCLEIARAFGMRLIGPNCVGLLDTHLPVDATFLPPPGPRPGGVALISHSGALCAIVIDWAKGQGFGLSRMVSLGNQLDLCQTDILEAVADDPHTRVLTLYLEGIEDGLAFVEQARRVALRKPIVALKVGRGVQGKRAVSSHTGALAGSEAAYDAAFRRAGILRAGTTRQLFDWARTLGQAPLPAGNAVAVLTNAGGPGVTAVDALEREGLQLAELEEATRSWLQEQMIPGASAANPVDMLASATPEQYAACLHLLLEDRSVHSVLLILPPPPASSAGAVARAVIPLIQASEKPVVIALMGDVMIREAEALFRSAGIPDYRFPEQAASALGALHTRAAFLRQETEVPPPVLTDAKDAVEGLLQHAVPDEQGFLPYTDALRLLEAYGIDTPSAMTASSLDETLHAASQIGYPVVVKTITPGRVHKSEGGGVALNLTSPAHLTRAYQRMAAKAQQDALQVCVHPMVASGQDVIVGGLRDPQFGPLILFGSGGVEVEGLNDVAFSLAPPLPSEITRMLEDTWAGRKLNGFRHLPRADQESVVATIQRMGALLHNHPTIVEIEINPLRVQMRGAIALDARVKVMG